jgi:hypothetical protein
MAGVPYVAVESLGATPEVPASGRTLDSPRQMGSVGEGDGVRVGVPEVVRLRVALRVAVSEAVAVL